MSAVPTTRRQVGSFSCKSVRVSPPLMPFFLTAAFVAPTISKCCSIPTLSRLLTCYITLSHTCELEITYVIRSRLTADSQGVIFRSPYNTFTRSSQFMTHNSQQSIRCDPCCDFTISVSKLIPNLVACIHCLSLGQTGSSGDCQAAASAS